MNFCEDYSMKAHQPKSDVKKDINSLFKDEP
jgi:hypothetical protein